MSKTADEMFSELGYRKSRDIYGDLLYIHETENRVISIKTKMCITFIALRNVGMGWSATEMTFGEVLACAQLIKEMEVRQ